MSVREEKSPMTALERSVLSFGLVVALGGLLAGCGGSSGDGRAAPVGDPAAANEPVPVDGATEPAPETAAGPIGEAPGQAPLDGVGAPDLLEGGVAPDRREEVGGPALREGSAPDLREGPAPGQAFAAAARTYRQPDWPPTGPRRDGVAFCAIAHPAWERAFFEVDPRRARAILGFRPAPVAAASKSELEVDVPRTSAFVTVTLFDTPERARQDLVAALAACTGRLSPEPELGEVTFGLRGPDGGLVYVASARGNVTFTVRSDDDTPIGALAAAVDAVVAGAPVLEEGQPATAPRVLGVEVAGEPIATQAIPLRLRLAPGAPEPAHVRFEGPAGVSVIETETGYALYAAQPGEVHLTGTATAANLQSCSFELTLEILPR